MLFLIIDQMIFKLGGQGAPLAPIYHKYIIENLNLNLQLVF